MAFSMLKVVLSHATRSFSYMFKLHYIFKWGSRLGEQFKLAEIKKWNCCEHTNIHKYHSQCQEACIQLALVFSQGSLMSITPKTFSASNAELEPWCVKQLEAFRVAVYLSRSGWPCSMLAQTNFVMGQITPNGCLQSLKRFIRGLLNLLDIDAEHPTPFSDVRWHHGGLQVFHHAPAEWQWTKTLLFGNGESSASNASKHGRKAGIFAEQLLLVPMTYFFPVWVEWRRLANICNCLMESFLYFCFIWHKKSSIYQ